MIVMLIRSQCSSAYNASPTNAITANAAATNAMLLIRRLYSSAYTAANASTPNATMLINATTANAASPNATMRDLEMLLIRCDDAYNAAASSAAYAANASATNTTMLIMLLLLMRECSIAYNASPINAASAATASAAYKASMQQSL